jgi:hypothetical protein
VTKKRSSESTRDRELGLFTLDAAIDQAHRAVSELVRAGLV